jgi:ABC-type branched-subunit amino acid transport system substrate-binding protein
MPMDLVQTLTILNYLQSQGWSQASIVFTKEDYGIGLSTAFIDYARDANFTILTQQSISMNKDPNDKNDDEARNVILNLKESEAKIFLFFGFYPPMKRIVELAKISGAGDPVIAHNCKHKSTSSVSNAF